MIKIAGHWELAWQAPINEYDLWIHPIREFGVDEFYMCPVTGLAKTRVHEADSIETIIQENPDLTCVFVDESADILLTDFVHPENALYILGKTSYSPYLTTKKEGDLSVKIPTLANNGGFWSHQAVSLILYDRYSKEN